MKNTLRIYNREKEEKFIKEESISPELYYSRIDFIFVDYFQHDYRQYKNKKYAQLV